MPGDGIPGEIVRLLTCSPRACGCAGPWKRRASNPPQQRAPKGPRYAMAHAGLTGVGGGRQQTAVARPPFASRRSPVRSRLAPLTDLLQTSAFPRSLRPGAVGTSGRCGSGAGREAPEAPLMPSLSIIPTACAVACSPSARHCESCRAGLGCRAHQATVPAAWTAKPGLLCCRVSRGSSVAVESTIRRRPCRQGSQCVAVGEQWGRRRGD